MATRINGSALAAMVAGSVLLYSGVTGRGVLQSIQAVVTGQAPTSTAVTNPISGTESGATGQLAPGIPVPTLPSGTSGGSPSANQKLAKFLTSGYRWDSGPEWDALVNLWNKESGWSNTADTRETHAGGDNASSTVFAYGISQARPYSKMPKSAWPPDKGGTSDAVAQINWGIQYIKSTYGSPSMAWAHEQANGWYLCIGSPGRAIMVVRL
jgi:resuscitation-promoting factor RpfB